METRPKILFLVSETNRCTELQFFFCITTLHVSGSLSAHHQEFLAVHRLWYILCNCDDRLLPGVRLVANGYHNCIKCTKADVWLRTPDDGQKDCPKHAES